MGKNDRLEKEWIEGERPNVVYSYIFIGCKQVRNLSKSLYPGMCQLRLALVIHGRVTFWRCDTEITHQYRAYYRLFTFSTHVSDWFLLGSYKILSLLPGTFLHSVLYAPRISDYYIHSPWEQLFIKLLVYSIHTDFSFFLVCNALIV